GRSVHRLRIRCLPGVICTNHRHHLALQLVEFFGFAVGVGDPVPHGDAHVHLGGVAVNRDVDEVDHGGLPDGHGALHDHLHAEVDQALELLAGGGLVNAGLVLTGAEQN